MRPGEGQHTDFTLEVVHEAPHTTSRIVAKGIASGTGHGVVQGRVIVKPEAQKSDSHQLSRALLLSPHAEIDQKPELEIFADDVKCGHGAAIGALDAEPAVLSARARHSGDTRRATCWSQHSWAKSRSASAGPLGANRVEAWLADAHGANHGDAT